MGVACVASDEPMRHVGNRMVVRIPSICVACVASDPLLARSRPEQERGMKAGYEREIEATHATQRAVWAGAGATPRLDTDRVPDA